MKGKTALLNMVTALAVLLLPATAQATDYLAHGRISYDAGSSLIKGLQEADWTTAGLNTLVLPGDTLWADENGTTEVEFSGGTWLRFADGSKAEVVSLPPNGEVRAWRGSFYVQRLDQSRREFIIATPACRVEVEDDTCARIDVVGEGATTVSVRWGRVTIRTDIGSAVYVHAGERVWIDPGMLPSQPTIYDRTEGDVFDAWNRERAQVLVESPQRIPSSVKIDEPTIGYSDLSSQGEWVDVDNRQYWRPTTVVNYVPYRQGYWDYVPGAGHVWVGNYPFSYVTSHYGRWRHHDHYGWMWSYDPVWSPAWVATVRYGDYFVWTPVDYYYRPVLYGSSHFSIGGLHFSLGVTSYVPHSRLYHGWDYVSPLQYSLLQNLHNPRISIWDIDTRRRRPLQVPFNNTLRDRRNYTPPRSIRGAALADYRKETLRKRIDELQSSIGRTKFSTVDRTGVSRSHTGRTSSVRSARIRNVSMKETTPIARSIRDISRTKDTSTVTRGSATRVNPIPTVNERGARTFTRNTSSPSSRTSSVRDTRTTTTPKVDTNRTRSTTPSARPSAATSTRTMRGGTSSRATTPTVTRTPTSQRPQNKATTPTRTLRGGTSSREAAPTITRTPVLQRKQNTTTSSNRNRSIMSNRNSSTSPRDTSTSIRPKTTTPQRSISRGTVSTPTRKITTSTTRNTTPQVRRRQPSTTSSSRSRNIGTVTRDTKSISRSAPSISTPSRSRSSRGSYSPAPRSSGSRSISRSAPSRGRR